MTFTLNSSGEQWLHKARRRMRHRAYFHLPVMGLIVAFFVGSQISGILAAAPSPQMSYATLLLVGWMPIFFVRFVHPYRNLNNVAVRLDLSERALAAKKGSSWPGKHRVVTCAPPMVIREAGLFTDVEFCVTVHQPDSEDVRFVFIPAHFEQGATVLQKLNSWQGLPTK